jgi:hypothetical protein
MWKKGRDVEEVAKTQRRKMYANVMQCGCRMEGKEKTGEEWGRIKWKMDE